ncbi:hypothetical protein Tco_1000708 [Tanacetum coccineum]
MADMNIPADNVPTQHAPAVAPPTITDDQILPSSKWVPNRKSNRVLDLQKSQGNLIFSIVVAILKNTNFFRSFTASSTIPAIYIQQFWDTMCFNSSTGLYNCQLDEQWFNQCKTAGFDRPRHHVLQILWGITHHSNIDYAERIWEEFVQSIQTFLTDRKNLATEARGKKKTLHLLIPNVRFTKLIIHHLRTKHNIHPRTGSPLHYSHEESVLNTLRFVGKDGREVFGMPIPDALLTDEITSAPYYSRYLEHVAEYQRCLDEEHGKAEEEDVTESPKAAKATKSKTAKQTKPSAPKASKVTKPPKPTPTTTEPSKKDQSKKRKLFKETFDAPSPVKQFKAGKVTKQRKPKSPLELVDEFVDEGVPEQEPVYGDEEADIQRERPERENRTQDKARQDQTLVTKMKARLDQTPSIQDEGQAGSNPGDAADFTNQFLVKKSQEDEPDKSNTEAEVQSMVTVPIHQDTSSVPLMTTPVIDLIMSQPVSTTVQAPLPTSTTTVTAITTTTSLPPPPPQPQQSTADPILVHRIALQKSLELDYSNQCLAKQEEARKKRRKRHDASRSPLGSPPSQLPPPPTPAGASSASGTSRASGSSQLPPPLPPPSTAWTTFDTRYESTSIARAQELSPSNDLMHDDFAPDEQVPVSDDQDSWDDHTPAAADSRKDWWKPLPEEERPTTLKPAWIILPSNVLDVENKWASALSSSYEPPA